MIPDILQKLYEDGSISKEDYESMTPLKKDYNRKFGNFLIENGYATKQVLKDFFKENQDYLFQVFDGWLDENSKVANSIIWRNNNSTDFANEPQSYNKWPKEKKQELSNTFWKSILDILPGLQEIPEYELNLSDDGTVFSTDLKPEEAWKYFVRYISHSLRVEIDRLVHWSMLRYDQYQLEYFLDSRTLFEYSSTRDVYSILRWDESLFSHGSVTIGDPERIYDFLDDEKLIGVTRWGTIGRFLGWCRNNLYHYKNGNTPENYEDHWQNKGYPPVERIISGSKHPDMGFQHFTAGCWGTTGFIRTVLRTINIPVLLEERCGHAMPHFVYDKSHEFYLSHGDDPYNSLYKHSTPQFIPLELIISKEKFNEWFDKSLPENVVCNNVGRHALELAVEYIPNEILKIYCDDITNNKTIEDGRVYNEIFRGHISIEELKSFGFWDRLKIKVEKLGGCENFL